MIGRKVLHAEEIARIVHPGDELEALQGHLVQPAGLQDTRVAHQEVQAAERFHAFTRQRLERRGAGHVGGSEKRPICPASRACAAAFSSPSRLLPGGLVQVGDDDVRPFPEEAFRDPLSEALRCPGDQGDLS